MPLLLSLLILFSALADDARGWLLKAQQHFQRQQWEKSRQAAAKALEIDPTLGDAEVILGLIATMRSDFSEAEKHFLRAVSFEPRNPRTHAYLGSTYLQEKRLDAATRSFGKVLELDPGNSAARYNLGLVALAADRPGEALGHFDHVGALLQYRNDEAALRAFQQGVQEFPKSWKMRLGLGSALYLAGKYEEAARALLEAVRIEPSAAPAYYLLGHAYESASSRQK